MTRLASDLSSNSQDPTAHIPLVLQPDQIVATGCIRRCWRSIEGALWREQTSLLVSARSRSLVQPAEVRVATRKGWLIDDPKQLLCIVPHNGRFADEPVLVLVVAAALRAGQPCLYGPGGGRSRGVGPSDHRRCGAATSRGVTSTATMLRSESGRALSAGVHEWLPRDPRVALARRRCSSLSESSTTVSAYRSVCAASAPGCCKPKSASTPGGRARCRGGFRCSM